MLRYRRYRVFVVFALIAVIAICLFGSNTSQVDYLKQQLSFHSHGKQTGTSSTGDSTQEVVKGGIVNHKDEASPVKEDLPQSADTQYAPPPVKEAEKPKQYAPPGLKPAPKGDDAFGTKGPVRTHVANAEELPQEPVKEVDGQAKPKSKKPAKAVEEVAPTKTQDAERVRVMPNPIPANAFENIHPDEPGQGRWDIEQSLLDEPPVLWEKPIEHFPINDTDVIGLPTGKPRKIPKIQAVFQKETAEQKQGRTAKQDIIKEAFLHAWTGYKANAWGHDELSPVTGKAKDPFNGWGATLVDSLDIIWMMGLTEEFEEAVEQVGKINFKTSRRLDIPLFETTIRYLGGMLGAYDVSGGKYRTLLDKAAELAEILIGAFDTPNRMPDTFYKWQPKYASQPHHSSSRVVLAELGSLALEFTRLAQLTKEPRYYDAIARITDALEEWQGKTRLPGMWPSHVDASGCEKTYLVGPSASQIAQGNVEVLDAVGRPLYQSGTYSSGVGAVTQDRGLTGKGAVAINRDEDELEGVDKKQPIRGGKVGTDELDDVYIKKGRIPGWDEVHKDNAATLAGSAPKLPPPKKQGSDNRQFVPLDLPEPVKFDVKVGAKEKRQLDLELPEVEYTKNSLVYDHRIPPTMPTHKHDDGFPSTFHAPDYSSETCKSQGLTSQTKWGTDDFTLGSLADSTYEYLPKMHLLLNGVTDQYRTMYEKAADAAKEKLLFRHMIPDEKREILVSGRWSVSQSMDTDGVTPIVAGHLKTTGSHLTCFAGGMFALGSKLFDRKDDLEIAKKLTDGCVYAYEMTASGIMPETFTAVKCDDRKSCPWNETKWWEAMDPDLGDWRIKNYEANVKFYESQIAVREMDAKNKKKKGPKKSVAETLAEIDAEDGIITKPVEDEDDEMTAVRKAQKKTVVVGYEDNDEDVEISSKQEPSTDVDDDVDDDEMSAVRNAQKSTIIVGEAEDYRRVKDSDVDRKKFRSDPSLAKRQIEISHDEIPDFAQPAAAVLADHGPDYWEIIARQQDEYEGEQAAKQMEIAKGTYDYDETTWHEPTLTQHALPPIFSPAKPLNHEQFVKKMIEEDRLPPGVQSMGDRRYILRPEALESVFYMHRITGSLYWRRAGWQMISSILKHTRTQLAHSAIDDVTKSIPKVIDSMESFWLAETLKYAWLLFEDEDKWSLDEWVFNTEAHPLRRTDVPKSSGEEGWKVTGKTVLGKGYKAVTNKEEQQFGGGDEALVDVR